MQSENSPSYYWQSNAASSSRSSDAGFLSRSLESRPLSWRRDSGISGMSSSPSHCGKPARRASGLPCYPDPCDVGLFSESPRLAPAMDLSPSHQETTSGCVYPSYLRESVGTIHYAPTVLPKNNSLGLDFGDDDVEFLMDPEQESFANALPSQGELHITAHMPEPRSLPRSVGEPASGCAVTSPSHPFTYSQRSYLDWRLRMVRSMRRLDSDSSDEHASEAEEADEREEEQRRRTRIGNFTGVRSIKMEDVRKLQDLPIQPSPTGLCSGQQWQTISARRTSKTLAPVRIPTASSGWSHFAPSPSRIASFFRRGESLSSPTASGAASPSSPSTLTPELLSSSMLSSPTSSLWGGRSRSTSSAFISVDAELQQPQPTQPRSPAVNKKRIVELPQLPWQAPQPVCLPFVS